MNLFTNDEKTNHVKLLSIGRSKNDSPRIWLEGGFDWPYQSPYTREFNYDEGTVTIRVHEQDERGLRVSRKSHGGVIVPVIDIANKALEKVFDCAERVVVEFFGDRIEIRQDEAEKRRIAREKAFLMRRTLRIASTFSGLGILDAAIHEGLKESVDVEHVLYSELDAPTVSAAIKNNPCITSNTMVIQGDMRGISNLKLPAADLLVAGPPCVSHSNAGRSAKGLATPEHDKLTNSLFFSTLKLCESLNPAVILFENVPSYATSISGVLMESVLDFLGYQMTTIELNGADFPQVENRKRVAMVFVSKGLVSERSIAAMLDCVARAKRPNTQSIGELMDDLPDEAYVRHEGLEAHEAKHAAKGNGFSMQLFRPEDMSINTLTAGIAKIRCSDPRLTLDGVRSRIPTAAEHARFKGIDEAFIEGVTSQTQAHRMLGNSCLPACFKAVAQGIGALRHMLLTKEVLAA